MAKYEDIFEAIKRGIVTGHYNHLRPIPSERALMKTYTTSRTAVRHAVDELVRAGLVRRHHGRLTEVVYGGRGRRIGLIPCVAESEFFHPLAVRISQLCIDAGYSLLFAATGPRTVFDRRPDGYAADVLSVVRDFVSQKVAGVIFQPVSFLPDAEAVNAKVLSVFRAAKIPVVLVDYDAVPPPRRTTCDVVGIDNQNAALRICAHLVAAGARRIHFFCRPHCSSVVLSRLRGVRLGVALADLDWGPRSVLECEPDDDAAIARHLTGRNRPDAIVCGFDAMALRVQRVARKLKIRVPGDLQVVGFDDGRCARDADPPLTTVRQPSETIAEEAFRRLLARIADPALPTVEIALTAPLIVRESTKCENEVNLKTERNRKNEH